MSFRIPALLVALAIMAPLSARAAPPVMIEIQGGRLDQAIIALGRQAGISIALADPSLGKLRVRAVRGRVDAVTALRRLLSGTDLGFSAIDAHSFRILRIPRAPEVAVNRAPATRPKPVTALPPIVPESPPPDLIVTASKRDTGLANFPGSVSVVSFEGRFAPTPGARGTGAIVDRLPVLSETSLGPGRNKLFIRGVADSSFSGPTEATVGQYLGDVRLNYNAPDPDIDLYDVRQVEVLEGPQGTLYGAGSLGGIVRLIPAPPSFDDTALTLRAGISNTAHGAHGNDFAAMVNLPLFKDRLALRAVGYRRIEGGYINDARRGLANVNHSAISGGRLALRVNPGNGWTVDAGLVIQDIATRDGQYSETNQPALARASSIAQPFDNDYRLGQITVHKSWGKLKLNSASAIVKHGVSERFDATQSLSPSPVAFDQDLAITLITNETKLSRTAPDGRGWVAGLSLVSDQERLTRALGDPAAPSRLSGVRNTLFDGALFGEWTFGIVRHVNLSLGARISFSRQTGEAIDLAEVDGSELARNDTRWLPLVAIAWQPVPQLIVYARYQEGYRTGGLSVARTGSGVSATKFEPDTIATYEVGTRFGDSSGGRFGAAIALSYAQWENIQADLVDRSGFPFSANIGNGRILGLSASATWRPVPSVKLEGLVFLNDSDLFQPAPGYARAQSNELPNIARIGGRIAASWSAQISPDWRLTTNGAVRYVGRSNLGVGTVLDISQGRYVDTAVDLRLTYHSIGISFGVTNLADVRANRFSLGNPFGVADRLQQTPLRPRTFRIGLDAAF